MESLRQQSVKGIKVIGQLLSWKGDKNDKQPRKFLGVFPGTLAGKVPGVFPSKVLGVFPGTLAGKVPGVFPSKVLGTRAVLSGQTHGERAQG
jgi:hypothetical protein